MTDPHRLGRDGSRLTILYDRDCGICGLTARTLRRWDRDSWFEGGWVLRPWSVLASFRSLVRAGYAGIARNRRAIGRWLGLELVCDIPATGGASEGR